MEWDIVAENRWHIVGENTWYIVAEKKWYIIGRLLTLDDARALASYAVTTHFKDMQVDTSVGHPPWPVYGAVLGKGHVDLDAAVRLLMTQSPDPARLRLLLEWWRLPPGQDMTFEEWYTRGLAYVRERFAAYLTDRQRRM